MLRHYTPTFARLNVFQSVMRQWNELHPYNAAHAYRLPGTVELPRLERAIGETYARNGLGRVIVSEDGRSFRYEVDEAPTVEVSTGECDGYPRLCEYLTREMNRPFAKTDYNPLRFAVIEDGREAHYLAVTYDHWVADSTGARMILRQILSRYCGAPLEPDEDQPLELYPSTYRETFGRHLRVGRLMGAAARLVARIIHSRSATLVPYSCVEQMAVGYRLFATAPGTVDRLRHFAHAQKATVHDVILAALSRALARCLPRRSLRNGGRELITGTIVDTRGDARCDLEHALGTFLGYYQVRCRPDDHPSLASLTQTIAAITRSIKQRRRYLDTVVQMKFMRHLWPHLRANSKPRFLRRGLAMAGGVSNVRMNDPWLEARVTGHPFDYLRVAPTGPMLPVVLTPTTLGDRLNLGVTYRLTGFSQAKFEDLTGAILDDLQQPEGTRTAGAKLGGERARVAEAQARA